MCTITVQLLHISTFKKTRIDLSSILFVLLYSFFQYFSIFCIEVLVKVLRSTHRCLYLTEKSLYSILLVWTVWTTTSLGQQPKLRPKQTVGKKNEIIRVMKSKFSEYFCKAEYLFLIWN